MFFVHLLLVASVSKRQSCKVWFNSWTHICQCRWRVLRPCSSSAPENANAVPSIPFPLDDCVLYPIWACILLIFAWHFEIPKNKHLDISFSCLQNQQGNPLLNILSLVVHTEKCEVHVRIAGESCDTKQDIPFWKILIKRQDDLFHFELYRFATNVNNKISGKWITKGQAFHVVNTWKKHNEFHFGIYWSHPILRFAIESYSKTAFIVWCCTQK